MSKIIDRKIENMSVPWENYTGGRVEEFIKEQFGAKAGLFYYDSSNNRYMVFADQTACDAYLEAPQENPHLLIAVFDAPFNYTAEISLITPRFNAVPSGATGVYLEFSFDTKNKSGQSTGEDVVCTFTFTRGSSRRTLSKRYRAGTTVRLCVDDYLETGTNNVTVGIIGQTTLAATTVGVTFQAVDLDISDSTDISRQYDSSAGESVEIPYSVSGFGTKVMEWYVDGVPLPYSKTEDEIAETETSRTKYISTAGLSQGIHSLQFRVRTVINGEEFYSKTLYRDFMVRSHSDKTVLIAAGAEFPMGSPLIGPGEHLVLHGMTQYAAYPLKLAVFNPSYAAATPLEVRLDGELLTTLSMRNNEAADYSISATSYGEALLTLKAGDTVYSAAADVAKSPAAVEEITQGLVLALSAKGKSNSSADRNKWEYGSFRTTFNGFKWLPVCGWTSGCLMISDGASVEINCAPLGKDLTVSGATLEFEFSTTNVSDSEAVVCDLRGDSGAGILITASEASLTSAGGAVVSTRYKPEENVRLSFVINKSSGVVNKTIIFLYVNGILSGAATYAANDNFISSESLRIASSADTDVCLRALRFYDTALTPDQILNNFILYRENAAELLNVYDRNNVYEDGSVNLSVDRLSGQLPVMIITGNIPALEATTDKNLQIDVDVEYINLQNPSRSFRMKNAAMRPQGTSSMSYPKKNFRLYTGKKDNTVLYDADGNIVPDRLYSFSEGAQPVDCWCLKADFAESSGTHNTGIARLWNNAMKNAQIDGQYRLRTMAQQSAADSGFQYDVRTTVDGFPILMFYRLEENSPLVFIGKYNFNNDKSTESVFGFCGVPGFDNSAMQCWEVLSNGHRLALFSDISGWDSDWQDAFEARYPDGSTDCSDLKAFAEWMASVTQADFASQKWEHLDVYKVAAYYVYLMRFGAVDQVVKNAMFTSEDGEHWFFINYDNDTICGLRNDGILVYGPDIDRQTEDSSFAGTVYAFAGHESRLWNMCEADDEFMEIVRKVDNALFAAGLSYDSVTETFDGAQSDKWCERIYNHDAQYKYIGPFTDRGVNNLFMLQGSRRSHRRWWLSERFAMLDAKYVSGEYKAGSFEVKLAGAPAGLTFGIRAAKDMDYGYGVNNVPVEYGVSLQKGDSHTFTTTSVLNVGDPLRIYAAPCLEEIDVSNLMPYMAQISIAPVYSPRLGTKLKKLVAGTKSSENTSIAELSGIQQAVRMQFLNIEGLKALRSLDLSKNALLQTLEAHNSGLTSVILPSGAPITSLQLPATLQALTLDGLTALSASGLDIQNHGAALTTLSVTGCTAINTQSLVENWLVYKSAPDENCSLTLDGVDWTGVDPDWLTRLGSFRNLSLRGKVVVTEASEEQLTALQAIFGNNCFSPDSEFYIQAPAGLFIVGPNYVKALSTCKYEVVATGAVESVELTLDSTSIYYSLDSDGYLTVGDIPSSASITLIAKVVDDAGFTTIKRKSVYLAPVVYPSSCSISGRSEIVKKGIYEYALTLGRHDDDAAFTTEWEVSGEALDSGLISVGETDSDGLSVIVDTVEMSSFNIKITVKKLSGTVLCSSVLKVLLVRGTVILTHTDNPDIMATCYSKGWAANSKYMTDAEASAVTDIGDAFKYSRAASFTEFQYFYNVDQSKLVDTSFSANIKTISVPFTEIYNFSYMKNRNVLNFPNAESIISRNNSKIFESNAVEINFPKLKSIDSVTMTINSCVRFDAPLLESVNLGYGSSRWMFSASALQELVLPALSSLDGNYNPMSVFFKGAALKRLVLPALPYVSNFKIFDDVDTQLPLEELDLSAIVSSDLNIRCSFSGLESLQLPLLKGFSSDFAFVSPTLRSVSAPALRTLTYTGTDAVGGFAGCPNLTEFDFSNVITLKGHVFSSGFWNSQGPAVILPKVTEMDSNVFSGEETAVTSLSMPCMTRLQATINLPNLTDLDIPAVNQSTVYDPLSGTKVKNLRMPSLKGGSYSLLGGSVVESFEAPLTTLYLASIAKGRSLKTLIFDTAVAPTINTNPTPDMSVFGADVPEGTPKTVYARTGATGYDSAAWTNFLETYGFTVSYTLPAKDD